MSAELRGSFNRTPLIERSIEIEPRVEAENCQLIASLLDGTHEAKVRRKAAAMLTPSLKSKLFKHNGERKQLDEKRLFLSNEMDAAVDYLRTEHSATILQDLSLKAEKIIAKNPHDLSYQVLAREFLKFYEVTAGEYVRLKVVVESRGVEGKRRYYLPFPLSRTEALDRFLRLKIAEKIPSFEDFFGINADATMASSISLAKQIDAFNFDVVTDEQLGILTTQERSEYEELKSDVLQTGLDARDQSRLLRLLKKIKPELAIETVSLESGLKIKEYQGGIKVIAFKEEPLPTAEQDHAFLSEINEHEGDLPDYLVEARRAILKRKADRKNTKKPS